MGMGWMGGYPEEDSYLLVQFFVIGPSSSFPPSSPLQCSEEEKRRRKEWRILRRTHALYN
jgi:hypothetical protein